MKRVFVLFAVIAIGSPVYGMQRFFCVGRCAFGTTSWSSAKQPSGKKIGADEIRVVIQRFTDACKGFSIEYQGCLTKEEFDLVDRGASLNLEQVRKSQCKTVIEILKMVSTMRKVDVVVKLDDGQQDVFNYIVEVAKNFYPGAKVREFSLKKRLDLICMLVRECKKLDDPYKDLFTIICAESPRQL